MCLSLLKQKLSFGKYIEIANLTISHAWLCPFIYLNISINTIRQIKLTWTMAVWLPKVPLYIHCHPPKIYCTWFILERSVGKLSPYQNISLNLLMKKAISLVWPSRTDNCIVDVIWTWPVIRCLPIVTSIDKFWFKSCVRYPLGVLFFLTLCYFDSIKFLIFKYCGW